MPTPSPAPLNPGHPNHDVPEQNQSEQNQSDLARLLTRLAMGESSVAEVLATITQTPANAPATSDASPAAQAPIDGATVDLGRPQRCGFGEVIYGQGKPSDLITRIARVQIDAGQNVLVTRIEQEAAAEVQKHFGNSDHNPIAKTLRLSANPIQPARAVSADDLQQTDQPLPHVAVVTAGSTDAPVAAEAIETLSWMGIGFQRFDDIGVAGPQRLISAVPSLQKAQAVIVVAGMEGALPSVVSGHLSVPIFAVPTSVGYGATLGGLTPLLGMLSSCAAGVAVVNIDAGFKAGYLAGLVIDQIRKAQT